MASIRSLQALCGALFCALIPATSQALQLGESEAQIAARHGAPAVEDHGRHLAMYFWTGWSAQVEFKNDVVGILTYRRIGYLTDAEIQSLLQANGGVDRWRETTNRSAQTRQWTRDDGANAQCATEHPASIVFRGGRALTPTEAILNDSFLQFAAPQNSVAATPAKTAGQTDEPMVLSNSAPAVASTLPAAEEPALPTKLSNPEPSASAAPAPAEPVAPPHPLARETAPVLPAALPPAVSVPPSAASGGVNLPGLLLIIASVALGAVAWVMKMIRAKKRRMAAPPRPVIFATPEPAPRPTPVPASRPVSAPALDSLRWDQFELLIGEIFRRQGYSVELSAALGADGGIDLMLRRDGESIPVQCKHWKSSRVAAREMREFYGAMTDTAAPRGIFVTTGSFTRDAREFAEGKSIELLDGPALDRQIAAIRRPEENIFDVASWIGDFTASARIFDPECPCCRGAMVIRHNRSTGAAFWGCATYPRCSGKRDPRTDLLAAAA